MAEHDDPGTVSIRHRQTHEQRDVAASALPFFVGPGKDFELADDAAAKLPARSASKADWIKFATGPGGLGQDAAEAMSRGELANYFSPKPGGDSNDDESQED